MPDEKGNSMYINKSVRFIRIKNILLYIIGIFLLAADVYILTSLFSTYYDDMYTFWNAKATPGCIRGMIGGVVCVIIAYFSERNIGDAQFYSNYFELDLNGIIGIHDLSGSCGRNEKRVAGQLTFFRRLYMKNFTVKDNTIILDSKTCECECLNCGAPIDKKIYFAGKCSYCGSSDVFAKVLIGNRIYSISTEQVKNTGNPAYYLKKNLETKRVFSVIGAGIASIFAIIAFCMVMDQLLHINDEEYLREILLSGRGASSFDLIRHDMVDLILWGGVLILTMLFVICRFSIRIFLISITQRFSLVFAKAKKSYVLKSELPKIRNLIRKVCRTIKKGYAKNCSIECVDGIFRISLAKKIQKDKCPYCGAPVVDVKNEQYKCPYCQRTVIGIVEKKIS